MHFVSFLFFGTEEWSGCSGSFLLLLRLPPPFFLFPSSLFLPCSPPSFFVSSSFHFFYDAISTISILVRRSCYTILLSDDNTVTVVL